MNEIAGVLILLCVMGWLFFGGLSLAFLLKGTNREEMPVLVWACILISPLMAGAALFFYLQERSKSNPNTPERNDE